ncbi:MAG: hypothetical protein MZW92_32910 [Comamonadaceae bacterium]|nr:hypothetical protein [Comamonadaceae bacterium]
MPRVACLDVQRLGGAQRGRILRVRRLAMVLRLVGRSLGRRRLGAARRRQIAPTRRPVRQAAHDVSGGHDAEHVIRLVHHGRGVHA